MEKKQNFFIFRKIYLVFLLLKIPKVINEEKNEIFLIINETLGTEIINSRYYDNISKILVNEKERNITNYKNYLNKGNNNITIIFLNEINSCEHMFYMLSNILYINTSGFNSNKVKSMSGMFQFCYSLISLDLSKFNTSSVTDMGYMLYDCKSLISLNLSNFNTSSVIYMDSIFSYCILLISLNLSNFNTKTCFIIVNHYNH